jgi:3-deoxy-D-manno-octulosonic-acid transferase
MRERRGRWPALAPQVVGGIWVHAASVGEARAAERLLSALAARGRPALLSVVTPAARALAAEYAASGAADVRFAPLDFLPWIRRAFRALQPGAIVIVETEIWPGLLHEAAARGLPLAFVSARLTEPSWKRLRALRPGLRRGLAGTWVAAQSDGDARRWIDLGVPAARVRVAGNIKYELPRALLDPAEREARRGEWRRIVVFGSVRAAEIPAVATALRHCERQGGPFLAVIAPRHPERNLPALKHALQGIVPLAERTRPGDALLPAEREIPGLRPGARGGSRAALLVGTVGELRRFYALADVVFVGGSLAPVGGHNLFEAAALGAPVLFGPHTDNVRDVAEALLQSGGGRTVVDGDELGRLTARLLGDEAEAARMGEAARRTAESMGGALGRTLAALEEWGFPVGAVEAPRPAARPPGLLRPAKKSE